MKWEGGIGNDEKTDLRDLTEGQMMGSDDNKSGSGMLPAWDLGTC